MAEKPKKKRTPSAQWDLHREDVGILYIAKRWSLENIVRYLKSKDSCLVATGEALKQKIRRWKMKRPSPYYNREAHSRTPEEVAVPGKAPWPSDDELFKPEESSYDETSKCTDGNLQSRSSSHSIQSSSLGRDDSQQFGTTFSKAIVPSSTSIHERHAPSSITRPINMSNLRTQQFQMQPSSRDTMTQMSAMGAQYYPFGTFPDSFGAPQRDDFWNGNMGIGCLPGNLASPQDHNSILAHNTTMPSHPKCNHYEPMDVNRLGESVDESCFISSKL